MIDLGAAPLVAAMVMGSYARKPLAHFLASLFCLGVGIVSYCGRKLR